MFAGFGLSIPAATLAFAVVAGSLWKLNLERRVYADKWAEAGTALDQYDQRSRKLTWTQLSSRASLRFALGYGGALLTLMSALTLLASSVAVGLGLGWVGASLLLAGECLERLLYFQTVVFDRMPRTL